MINLDVPSTSQIEVFELQVIQLLQRNPVLKCSMDRLETHSFEIYFNRNRIVKSPGYEILLENIENFSINCEGFFNFESEGINYEIKFKS